MHGERIKKVYCI